MALHSLKIIVYDGGKVSGGALGSDDTDRSEKKSGGKKSKLYKLLNLK